MSRESEMKYFIAEAANKAASRFVEMLADKSPEFMTEEEKRYAHKDMQRNIELYLDGALDRAREADEKEGFGRMLYA